LNGARPLDAGRYEKAGRILKGPERVLQVLGRPPPDHQPDAPICRMAENDGTKRLVLPNFSSRPSTFKETMKPKKYRKDMKAWKLTLKRLIKQGRRLCNKKMFWATKLIEMQSFAFKIAIATSNRPIKAYYTKGGIAVNQISGVKVSIPGEPMIIDMDKVNKAIEINRENGDTITIRKL